MISIVALVNALSWLAQTTVVIAAGLLVLWTVRIDAPATRYAALRLLLLSCLLLPAVQPRLPLVPASLASVEPVAAGLTAGRAAGSAGLQVEPRGPEGVSTAGVPVDAVLLAIAFGIIVRLSWIAAGVVRLRALRRAGEIAPSGGEHDELQALIGARAAIRYVPHLGQPVTFGFQRPVVLLPERLRHLPAPIQRAVAAHELWHVRRRDWMWTVAEETVRAALWFHPAMWVLLSRIQASREEVVDELSVLTTGSRKNYLDALLTFADERPLFAAAAFARRRHLVRRMLLISKESVMSSRRIVASTLAVGAAVVAAGWYSVLAFPLTQSQAPPRDPVPKPRHSAHASPDFDAAKLDAIQKAIAASPVAENYTHLATYHWEKAFRDYTLTHDQRAAHVEDGLAAADNALANDGQFVPALIYKNLLLRLKASMEANIQERERLAAEADALRSRALELRKGQSPEQRRNMEAKIYDAATSGAQLPPPPPPPPPPAAAAMPPPPPPPPPPLGFERVDGLVPVRADGTVPPPSKVRDVRPEYPPIAKAAGVQGVVVVEVLIDAAGRVRDARVLNSIPLLDKAALDAVRQWEFTPTVIDGEASPVIVTATVGFALK